MGHKFVTIAVLVCVMVAYVHSAPQLKNRGSRQYQNNAFQPQPQQPQFTSQPRPVQPQPHAVDPERQSRFLVVNDEFHQEPNGEYNFE